MGYSLNPRTFDLRGLKLAHRVLKIKDMEFS